MKLVFDMEPCGRCGGSGRFSFNLMDGDRCYGCSGSGKQYTRKGKKAHAIFEEMLQVPVAELQPGYQLLALVGFNKHGWRVYASQRPSSIKVVSNGVECPMVDLLNAQGDVLETVHATQKVRVRFTAHFVDKARELLSRQPGVAIVEDTAAEVA